MPRMIMVVELRPIDRDREDEFNDWYDNNEIPGVLATPGFISASRYVAVEPDEVDDGSTGRYLTIWEIDAESPEAAQKMLTEAMGAGKWSLNEAVDYSTMTIRFFKPLSQHITR